MKNLKIQSPRAPKQKISDMKGKDWRSRHDQFNLCAREQGDLRTDHNERKIHQNFDFLKCHI